MRYLVVVLFAFLMFSCGEEFAGLSVEEYILENNLETKELDKGVHIIINELGNSKRPNINSVIKFNYVGTLTDGTVFDSGTDAEFPLSNLIEGWRIGLKEIGEGGSCKLIIPPAAGYGNRAVGTIPPNSVLVFDMELLEVK